MHISPSFSGALTIACLVLADTPASAQEVLLEEEIRISQPENVCREVRRPLIDSRGTMCALTGISGRFDGAGERGHVVAENGAWVFYGSSCQPGVSFQITCAALSRGRGNEASNAAISAEIQALRQRVQQQESDLDALFRLLQRGDRRSYGPRAPNRP